MVVFWLIAVLLMVAALVFVLPPLFRSAAADQTARRAALNVSIYRDQLIEMSRDLDNDVLNQEQYQLAREEIEQRMMDDVGDSEINSEVGSVAAGSKVTAVTLALLIPAAAIALYINLGTPEGLVPEEYQPPEMSEQQTADMINQMVERLAVRLEGDPSDAEGWKMLGRSFMALRQFGDARKAYEEAVLRLPADAQLMLDLADTIAMTSGQSLEGRPMELIKRALLLEPENEKGLWLAGTAAYERKAYREALSYWQRLYVMQPPMSEGAKVMERNIAEIQTLLGEPVTVPAMAVMPGGGDGTAAPAVSAGLISGEVSIATALMHQADPGDSVFIFAQAVTGPKMPLAVFRTTVAELPLSFTLDDSMAMMPSMRLSRFADVMLTARVSKSGNASPQSGDLQGSIGPLSSDNSSGIHLLIDALVP